MEVASEIKTDLVAHIDDDHRQLAKLIDRVGAVRPPNCGDCANCAPERVKSCCGGLLGVARDLQSFLLQHLQHEEQVMEALPHTARAQQHCREHREDHVRFTTRFNRSVASIRCADIHREVDSVLEILVDWSHSHALTFDHELIELAATH